MLLYLQFGKAHCNIHKPVLNGATSLSIELALVGKGQIYKTSLEFFAPKFELGITVGHLTTFSFMYFFAGYPTHNGQENSGGVPVVQ